VILSGFDVVVVVVRLIKRIPPEYSLGVVLIVDRFFHDFENLIEFFFV
jgi:hypothetical protein